LRDGTARRPTANTAFVGLATKFLQVNPGGTIPLKPPAFYFAGDRVAMAAQGMAGHINLTASNANIAAVKTELQWQPLRFAHQSPLSKGYRTQAFMLFTVRTLSIQLPTAPGWYVPAFRFVYTATGQETGLQTLATVYAT
jgi:hypothetical protein